MKSRIIILILLIQAIVSTQADAQHIAINGNGSSPDTSAILDVSSTSKGLLIPRMTTSEQNAIVLPAKGLLIFNITTNSFMVNTGTSGSPSWNPLLTNSGAISSLNGLTAATQTFALGTTGTNVNMVSSGSTHTLNLPAASATATGLVNIGAQTFAGDKTFTGTITATNLPSGASTDSIVTTDATGILKKRTSASIVGSNAWSITGNAGIAHNTNFIGTTDNVSLRFRTNNLPRMMLDSTGRVGIGVTNPSELLQVNGNGLFGLVSQGTIKISTSDDPGNTDIYSDVDKPLRITNAGIGSYGASLQLKSSSQNFLFSFEGHGGFRYFSRNSNAVKYYVDDTGEMHCLGTGSSSFVGRVGVGLASPSELLQVNGNALFGVNTQTGLLMISNSQATDVTDMYTNDNVTLRIGNAGVGNTGASLQLKPSSQNYLFSFEGRGGFRYFSRALGAERFKVDDTGEMHSSGTGSNSFLGSVGVGTTTPNSTLQTDGSVSMAIRTITGASTATSTDYTIVSNNVSGAITLDLPTAVGIAGRVYVIKKISATSNDVTIDANGSQTIDGATTLVLSAQYATATIQSDGANWIVL
ncbi:MAG: hypothetical protein ABIP10_19410 [Ferruginibacter sp.]